MLRLTNGILQIRPLDNFTLVEQRILHNFVAICALFRLVRRFLMKADRKSIVTGFFKISNIGRWRGFGVVTSDVFFVFSGSLRLVSSSHLLWLVCFHTPLDVLVSRYHRQ